ncbi:unnamed protein product, partial [Rotaria sordida]
KDGNIGNLSINTIIRLACLVLDTNCFVFDNKYYKQIRGGAMGSPFTMTLANIYMYEWEQSLIQHQQIRNELYGRYIDDIFMTSNESIENIKALLDQANEKDPNIRINYIIHESVEFLDVLIENVEGKLTTSVFRKPAAEPYIHPYTSDHPRHIHSNTINTALLRGIRICSDVHTFDQERLKIEMALLLNGYPPKFIKRHFKELFKNYHASEIYQDLDEQRYKELHLQLLNESLTDHHQQQLPANQQSMTEQQKNTHKKHKQNKEKELVIHYRYESGPLNTFSREFKQL